MNSRSLNNCSTKSFIEIINKIKGSDSFQDHVNFEGKYKSLRKLKIDEEFSSGKNYSDKTDEQKNCIKDLLKRLQEAKYERKLAEKNNTILENRLKLLNIQEKSVIILNLL
jgi:hypothetical protein